VSRIACSLAAFDSDPRWCWAGASCAELEISSKVAQSRTPRAVPVARLVMEQRGSGLRIRLPRGDSIRIAEVSLPARDGPGHLQLLVSDDFAAVEATLKRLAADGSPAFASPVFRPALMLEELFAALQMGDGPRVPAVSPQAELLSAASMGREPAPVDATGLALLKQTCGSCHVQATVSPPGFLHGDEAMIARQLQACAPRLWVRLQAWMQPVSKRAATPMPLPHIVALRSDSPGQWPHSLTYRRLSNYIASLLAAPGSQTARPAANVARSCTRAVAALTSAR